MVCSGLAQVEWAQAVREGRGAELGLRPGRDQKEEQTDQQLGYGLEGYGETGYLCGEERGSE